MKQNTKKSSYAVFAIAAAVLIILAVNQFFFRKSANKIRVAFVVTTLSNPFFVEMTEAAKDRAKEKDSVEVLVHAPLDAADTEAQARIFENLITQKVDAICIVPADSLGIAEVISKADKASIPVINVDNRIDSTVLETKKAVVEGFIGSDNYLGGKLAAEFLAKRLNYRGTVAILEGVAGVEAGIQRKEGFLKGIEPFTDIKIVATQAADWSREKAFNITQNIILANPTLDAIFACNDEMALGAAGALDKQRKIQIVGFDATDEAKQAVKAGKLAATVEQMPKEMGAGALELALESIQKQGPQVVRLTPLRVISE